MTLWVRNIQFCNTIEAIVQELLPLLPLGFFMPISLYPWRKHQVSETPKTPFLARSCGSSFFLNQNFSLRHTGYWEYMEMEMSSDISVENCLEIKDML